jgi:CzcA family heavy metal efflux pump
VFDRVIAFSIHNRLLVVAGAALVLVYGTYVLANLPVDVLPDLNRPTVTLLTEAEGLAPEEVETLVTLPIEQAMNGAAGVERVRSVSGIGLSIVYVEFGWGADVYLTRQLVTERLQAVALPDGVVPALGPVSSVMGQIMLVGLTTTEDVEPSGDGAPESALALRDLAEYTVRTRLQTIPGVSNVIAIGGGVRQVQVRPDPSKLRAFGLTLDDVETALAGSAENGTGGYLERSGEEALVRVIGRTTDLAEIGRTVVTGATGTAVTVADVAEVAYGAQTRRGDAGVDGRPGVILSVEKQPGANTVALTEEVDAALDELEAGLPAGVEMNRDVFRQAPFIEAAIGNVEEALRDGAILVVIILFLFLLNFRTTAITLTAIPLSIVVTALVFKAFGVTINTMTLGGLAVAIGELVDDAIVDVENVFRRLRENHAAGRPKPPLQVVREASSEVRSSIVYATVLIVLVFLPLFALQGVEGKIFAPLGVAYITSILASLVVAMTVTPALCAYLLPDSKAITEREHDGWLVRTLKGLDRRVLRRTLRHPEAVMGVAGVLVLAALLAVPTFGRTFLPPFNEGSFTVNVLLAPGTSLDESARVGRLAERRLLAVDGVEGVGRRTGRAERDEHAEGVHYNEVDVEIEAGRDPEAMLPAMRAALAGLPGASVSIGQPIGHRLDHLLSGVRAQVAVKVFGDDLPALRRAAEAVRVEMAAVPGMVDVSVEQQVLIPQVRVEVDREAARRAGANVGAVNEAIETAFAGETVGQVVEGQRGVDVVVRYPEGARSDVAALAGVLVPTAGGPVPLSSVARVVESTGPNQIVREDVQRRVVVSANVQGRDLVGAVEEAQARVAERVALPAGAFVEWGGQFESQRSASRLIGILSLFSLAGMVLVLYVHFRSFRIVAQVLLNVPLALVGSVFALWLSGEPLSIAALVGFITLTGIAARNGILMISHYVHLVKEEGESFSEHMIVRGSVERLVPVLMTATTAGLALVPLVLSAGEPGKEILYPVAVVILGGLVSSTLLDLVLTPAVFFRYGRPALEAYLAEQDAHAGDGHTPGLPLPPAAPPTPAVHPG